jgi:uncharacterized hydrophobic protein (TIGR00271 family)
MLHDLNQQIINFRPNIAESITIGVFRPRQFAAKTKVGRFTRRLKATLPILTLADRVSLFDRIQGGARVTPDYIVMMALSVLIASFGLVSDNTSVVIGAMLVAPFMTPLVGIGLALAQGNLALLKRSAKATGVGLIVGISVSFTIGIVVPMDELPLEVLARGDPNIVDMAIAFVSGMAAAYAVSRESVAEAIVGVAIAAALVPPLACVGIMIAEESIFEAEGAALLLLTNLAAIALGAAFVFRRLGVPGTRTGQPSHLKVRWVGISLNIIMILLVIPLVYRLAGQLAVGQTRPMSFRVSSSVKNAVQERIDREDNLDVIYMSRSGSGMSKRVRILLVSKEPVTTSLVEDIKLVVQDAQKVNSPVEIGVFLSAVEPDGEVAKTGGVGEFASEDEDDNNMKGK